MSKQKKVKLNFWVTEEMWNEIDKIVTDEDLNFSIFARRALRAYLKRNIEK